MYVCMYVCIYICVYVCMYVCMYTCMYCMYVCTYVKCICIRISFRVDISPSPLLLNFAPTRVKALPSNIRNCSPQSSFAPTFHTKCSLSTQMCVYTISLLLTVDYLLAILCLSKRSESTLYSPKREHSLFRLYTIKFVLLAYFFSI